MNRLASVIIALACIVVAGIAVHVTDGISGEVVRTVDVNHPAGLDNAIVTVTGVRAGQAISTDSDETFTSKGMILAVTVRVEAPGQKYTLGGLSGISLHTADRTYSVFGPNTSVTAEAGFVSTGELLFEVDPRHIAGAYVELYRQEIFYVVPAKLRVRLGITRTNADRWAASARNRTLPIGRTESEPLS
ncbi:hypothetical protein [Microlunatus sp. Gsoil 973]|uniref:hypothetical protein n=1 Tax=Microlunatus sp. Gsoil 973 TaxID=2672569 RepID=UPI0012B4B7DF|nr:hypothetical protein [Microlunatus sp. Gsoil 973]QGN34512.1 hypothetical protein GJV80_18705 [Microlunatus sp. Gsoil 973]